MSEIQDKLSSTPNPAKFEIIEQYWLEFLQETKGSWTEPRELDGKTNPMSMMEYTFWLWFVENKLEQFKNATQ